MSLYDVKTGKKMDSMYDIATGKKLAKVYSFTPSGYQLVYNSFYKMWESGIQPYSLTNLQLDDNGWVYPTYRQYGFEQYSSSGGLLNYFPSSGNIIGDLSIDIDNDMIGYVTTKKFWQVSNYTSYNQLSYGTKNSDSVYSFNDAVSSPFNLPQYKSLMTAGSDAQYDLQKNNSADWSPFTEKSFSIAGHNAHLLPLGGFDTNFNLVKYAVLAYSASGIEVINPVSSTNITVNNNLNALLSNIKLQYSPVGYAKNVASQDSKRNFPAVYYLISKGNYVFLVELYYDTVLGNLSIYSINSWSTGNDSDFVNVIQDDDGYTNSLVGYSLVKDSASNMLAVPSNSFSFYATVANGNSNKLVRVSYNPDTSFGTFTSNNLDTWSGFTPIKGEKKSNQVSIGLCTTTIPWKYSFTEGITALAGTDSGIFAGVGSRVVLIDISGKLIESYGVDNSVESLSIDNSEKYLYIGTDSNSIYKLDVSKSPINLIWKIALPYKPAYGIAVDTQESGSIYVGSDSTDTTKGEVYKIDSSGSILWSFQTVGNNNVILSDNSGDIYVGTYNAGTTYDGTLYKISSEGNKKWSLQVSDSISSLAVDSDNNVYVASDNILEVDSSGNKLNTYDISSRVCYGLAVNESNNIIAGATGIVYKFNRANQSSSEKISPDWNTSLGNLYIKGIYIDSVGSIYAGGSDGGLYKLTPSGSNTDSYYQSKVVSYKV